MHAEHGTMMRCPHKSVHFFDQGRRVVRTEMRMVPSAHHAPKQVTKGAVTSNIGAGLSCCGHSLSTLEPHAIAQSPAENDAQGTNLS
jgi:hypothetical protein